MTRRRIRKAPDARDDINDISEWIAQTSGSVDVAMKWLTDLYDEFDKLALTPGRGTSQEELMPGLRNTPFGNYLIFFRSTKRVLTIVRVMHGARDYGEDFE
jgi:toxin ParE1/3/4